MFDPFRFQEDHQPRPPYPLISPPPQAEQQEVLVTRRRPRRRIASAVAAGSALVAKFGAALKAALFAGANLKLLATAGTALVSIAAYSLYFGWGLAVWFVLLLFVHELGHVIQLRREGIKASPPMFVPFLGAVVAARSLGDDAAAEARVGLAGPVLGSLGAAAVAVFGFSLHSELLKAAAYLGFFVNLFNLLPVVPLDGGRAMAAMSPWMWFAGFGLLLALALNYPNPVLLLIVLLAAIELYRRWHARRSPTPANRAYYAVPRRTRLEVGLLYLLLVVLLVLGMEATHITQSGGHTLTRL